MSKVNFYLKTPEKHTGKSLIYLQFKYNKNRLVYSFGQTIDPLHWNANKQRVKGNKETTADGKYLLNHLLDALAGVCENAYNIELKNGIPSTAVLKQYLSNYVNQNSHQAIEAKTELFDLFDKFIDNEIQSNGKSKKRSTLTNYRSVKTNLLLFQKETGYKLFFDTIDLNFFYKYVTWLKTKHNQKTRAMSGMTINTIACYIRILKTVLNEAVDQGLTTNLTYKHRKFRVSQVATDSVYLSLVEIQQLYNFDFSYDKKLEQVRDLFVFGCFTGLRYSDYSSIGPENIIERKGQFYIKVIPKKTNDLVIVPCHPIVLQIFEKYSESINKLPKAYVSQSFNNNIKEALRIAGFVEAGRLVSEPNKPLYQCVTSHCARRSFATNWYLIGYPTVELMKITGHKTEKSFLLYIKVSKLDAAERMAKYLNANWDNDLKILQDKGLLKAI